MPQHSGWCEHILWEIELSQHGEVLRVEDILKIPQFAIREIQITYLLCRLTEQSRLKYFLGKSTSKQIFGHLLLLNFNADAIQHLQFFYHEEGIHPVVLISREWITW